MILLDGKTLKQKILDNLKEEVSHLEVKPKLVVIQVGNDPASCVYVKQKANMAKYIGYDFLHLEIDSNITQAKLLEIINDLNFDDTVDGILVQMPLPKQLDANIIANAIFSVKDVDGLTDVNTGMLVHNKETLVSCTPQGIIDLLKAYNISLEGKNVVIVGRSILVGKPLANLLINLNATVTVCHSKTKNLKEITKTADILVSAVGKKHFIKEDMVKENAIIVDVGINRENDKLYGDVDLANVKNKVSYITPVPGGVGPMTVAELAKNVLKAYNLRRNK